MRPAGRIAGIIEQMARARHDADAIRREFDRLGLSEADRLAAAHRLVHEFVASGGRLTVAEVWDAAGRVAARILDERQRERLRTEPPAGTA
jgi:hypothetical protein